MKLSNEAISPLGTRYKVLRTLLSIAAFAFMPAAKNRMLSAVLDWSSVLMEMMETYEVPIPKSLSNVQKWSQCTLEIWDRLLRMQ